MCSFFSVLRVVGVLVRVLARASILKMGWKIGERRDIPTQPRLAVRAENKGMLATDLGVARVYDVLKTFVLVYALVMLCFSLLVRLWVVLPARVRQKKVPPVADKSTRVRTAPASTLVIFGSGGHTKEMLTLLKSLTIERYKPLYFVRASTDQRTEGMVRTCASFPEPTAFYTIPRSREVLQSWLTTPFTTLRATLAAFLLVLRLRPDVIICNGPGTCVPICMSAFLLRILGVAPTKIIFVESFCRVKSLSMTGKILYYLVDRFIVQWPGLKERYPLVEYIGPIC